MLQVQNQRSWVEAAQRTVEGNKDRACLVIADNCERDYFIQGLLNVSDDVYLSTGRTDAALRAAAVRFVELSRSTLRGCFFIFFTNDQDFALAFNEHVNNQHKGLVDIKDLMMPNELQKEAIVRINVNRLNPFSYWFCIDRAGPDEKKAVWHTLKSAETFPASFAAVDNAIRSSAKNREGKPARKCVLNAFVLTNATDAKNVISATPDGEGVEDVYLGTAIAIRQYRTGWAAFFGAERKYLALASEWNLRLIVAAEPTVSAILAGDARAKDLIDRATIYHPPGTHTSTKAEYDARMRECDTQLSASFTSNDNSVFWMKGSVRNHDYESKLKQLYPTYNTKGAGFLGARPDLVIADNVPCSILRSADPAQDKLNAAIRREANVVEFTAIKDFTFEKVINYLREQKLQNYINAVQEQ